MPGKQEVKKPEDRIVTWGKHRNKRFGDVPTDYLSWFLSLKTGIKTRQRWAEEELERRKN